MPRNIYIVNKNRRPPAGGGPPGDFGKSLSGGVTPTGALTTQLIAPPPPQNFFKTVGGVIAPSGVLTRTLIVPPPPSSNYPHQPAGYVRLREHACDTLGDGGTTPDTFHRSIDLAGVQWSWYVWTSYTRSGIPKFTLHNEPGTPRGDSYLRYMLWGIGFAEVEFASARFPEQRELYISTWIRVRRNADGGYWVHPTGDKIGGFFHYATLSDNSDNNGILACAGYGGAPNNTLTQGLKFGIKQQDNVAVNTFMGNPEIPLMQWVHLEWIFKLNTLGQANGVLQLWTTLLGGSPRLAIDRSNMTYITVGAEAGFVRYKLRPMHGGTNTPTPPNPDFVDIAHIYISGKPK